MTDPHYPMSYPTDAHPVRPGTSAALTARAIDATVHPPLVRAQETAATIVPRVAQAAAPLASPIFLGLVAFTLLFILIARRLRYRPSAIALGALLIVTLSSFYPMHPQAANVGKGKTPRTLSRSASIQSGRQVYSPYGSYEPPAPPEPVVVETPPTPALPDVPDYGVEIDPRQWLPPDMVERLPDVSRDLMRAAEQRVRESEQMRALMRRIERRLREEARREHLRRMTARRYNRQDFEPIGIVITP